MHFQQSQRALDVMRCALPEQRRCSRIHLPIRALATFPDLSFEPQAALLRDVNMLGAFFYSKQRPNLHSSVTLEFDLPEMDHPATVSCEGTVVRVEAYAPGAAIGVAIEFTRYDLRRTIVTDQPHTAVEDAPFIGWTVEMVERMIEKSVDAGRHRGRSNAA